MPSLSAKDRVSLCLFSFEDGRRCRTPRISSHPHFCFCHAQKEAQAQATQSLAKDLAAFFSGDYLSACDLNTAMARLIPAVIRGDIKPRLARTVAYMMQGLIQTVHLAKDEYINAFGADGWRKAVRSSVTTNYDYRFPATPKPEPQPAAATPPQAAAATPPQPTRPLTHSTASARPSQHNPTPPQSTPALNSAAPAKSPAPAEDCHPERSEGPCHNPTSPTTIESHLSSAPNQPTPPANSTPPAPATPSPQPRPSTPNRDPYAVHFDHNYRLRIDGKPF